MAKYLEGSTRQLTDLRIKPSASMINGVIVPDDRPLFDLGEMPVNHPDLGIVPPFRTLRFHPVSREEVCAKSQAELEDLELQGYVRYEDLDHTISNPVEAAQDALAGLTDAERALVLDEQRKTRVSAVSARLAKLSEAQLAAALDQAVPVKRKPGRPRKVE